MCGREREAPGKDSSDHHSVGNSLNDKNREDVFSYGKVFVCTYGSRHLLCLFA